MTEPHSLLIIASSEADSNLYYACGFLAPDPFVYVDVGGRRLLLMTDLEIDRARAQARVDEVLSYSAYESKARQRWPRPHLADVVTLLLEDLGLGQVAVPASFPLEYADRLRERGIGVSARPDPLFPERLRKSPEEVAAIAATQRHTEAALQAALDALRQGEIRGDLVYRNGRPLTAEDLRKIVNVALMENDCVAQHTIIACGADGADPHNEGSGPIRPHASIVFDIFPRSSSSRYFADMTRTVVKGRASDALKGMYDAVLAAQLRGIELIRAGTSGLAVHTEVAQVLQRRGFETGVVDGRNQGFFHGTGHGVGLDIHEPPRIGKVDWCLEAGNVMTVEPGLYYPRWGAVRIEDMVVVEPGGCRNLTSFPKGTLLEL
ncbi:MAG TPA: Xaa-Pro peptidase family protein [Methylomirabilota bacterium]|jgi:Xaa-Pro aminopeptidase|nr:Xaa-Pro peptidase family protein [Methylomirabilota bacterium]